jgi:hypothetical protein
MVFPRKAAVGLSDWREGQKEAPFLPFRRLDSARFLKRRRWLNMAALTWAAYCICVDTTTR